MTRLASRWALALLAAICAVLTTFPDALAGGGRIIYQYHEESGPQGVFSIRADGTGRERLFAGDAFNLQWSPDKTRVAFLREECESGSNCRTHIYVMDADGSGVTRFSDQRASNYWLAWSPDGQSIAFEGVDDDGVDTDVFVAYADGEVHQLTDTSDADERRPNWSPDGQQLVFVRDSVDVRDVFTIDRAAANERNLTNDDHFEGNAQWSPDGTRIAYSTTRDDETVGEDAPYTDQLYVMDRDGSNAQSVSRDPDTRKRDPQWSRDGTRLTWWEECDDDYCGADYELWVGRPGSRARRVTDNRRLYESLPQWSSNGRRLIFQAWRRSSANSKLYTVRADGTGLRRLTAAEGAEGFFDWQTW